MLYRRVFSVLGIDGCGWCWICVLLFRIWLYCGFSWVPVLGVLFNVVWLLLLIARCFGSWWVLFDCLCLVCRLALTVLVVLVDYVFVLWLFAYCGRFVGVKCWCEFKV